MARLNNIYNTVIKKVLLNGYQTSLLRKRSEPYKEVLKQGERSEPYKEVLTQVVLNVHEKDMVEWLASLA
jgi:hypothetical protein